MSFVRKKTTFSVKAPNILLACVDGIVKTIGETRSSVIRKLLAFLVKKYHEGKIDEVLQILHEGDLYYKRLVYGQPVTRFLEKGHGR